jgi:hypothetical protein
MGLLYDELKYNHVRWFSITMGEMDPMKVAIMADGFQVTPGRRAPDESRTTPASAA